MTIRIEDQSNKHKLRVFGAHEGSYSPFGQNERWTVKGYRIEVANFFFIFLLSPTKDPLWVLLVHPEGYISLFFGFLNKISDDLGIMIDLTFTFFGYRIIFCYKFSAGMKIPEICRATKIILIDPRKA